MKLYVHDLFSCCIQNFHFHTYDYTEFRGSMNILAVVKIYVALSRF